jgi:hypothetical protein
VAITVSRGLRKAIDDDPGSIQIEVFGAADVDSAAAALEHAANEIMALDGGWNSAPGLRPGDTNGPTFVSAVVRTSTGVFVTIDGGYTPLQLLATIPDHRPTPSARRSEVGDGAGTNAHAAPVCCERGDERHGRASSDPLASTLLSAAGTHPVLGEDRTTAAFAVA